MPASGEVERDKGQQLLDEIHAVNAGLDRLASAVEELTDVLAAAADIELSDEEMDPTEGAMGSQAGEALGALGSAFFSFIKNAGASKEPQRE